MILSIKGSKKRKRKMNQRKSSIEQLMREGMRREMIFEKKWGGEREVSIKTVRSEKRE